MQRSDHRIHSFTLPRVLRWGKVLLSRPVSPARVSSLTLARRGPFVQMPKESADPVKVLKIAVCPREKPATQSVDVRFRCCCCCGHGRGIGIHR